MADNNTGVGLLDDLSKIAGRPVKALGSVQPTPTPATPKRNDFMVEDHPSGLVSPGNLNIWNRPVVQNSDGSHSTEYSRSFQDDKGREVLVPTVVNGKFLTPDGKKPKEGSPEEKAMFKRAWQHYEQTGENLGAFDNPKNADAYAQKLHNRGEQTTGSMREQDSTGRPSLESLAGHPLNVISAKPIVSARFRMWSDEINKGADPETAWKLVMAGSAMPPDPSKWVKFTTTPPANQNVGKVHKAWINQGEDPKTAAIAQKAYGAASEVMHRFADNPFGVNDKKAEAAQKEFSDYLKAVDLEALKRHGLGGGHLEEAVGSFDETMAGTVLGQLSPMNLAILVASWGSGPLIELGIKAGMKEAIPVVKTLSNLAQLQFTSSMIEGAASGLENFVKGWWNGDWKQVGQGAAEALVGGVMSKMAVSHEVAEQRVRGDLEETARKMYGKPEGGPLESNLGSRFDQLNPYDQGLVIHETVQNSPEYKATLSSAEDQTERERKKREKTYSEYHSRAVEQAWEPDTVKRTINGIFQAQQLDFEDAQVKGLEKARQHYLRQIVSRLRTNVEDRTQLEDQQRQEDERAKQEGREKRPTRKAEEAKKKNIILTNAEQIRNARVGAVDIRERADRKLVEDEGEDVRRVDAQKDQDGHVYYRANYQEAENRIGVSGDANHIGVYRKVGTRDEVLTSAGTWETKEKVGANAYIAPDEHTAQTLAQIVSLRMSAEDLAAKGEKGSAHEQEVEFLYKLQGELIRGEKTADQVRNEAKLADDVELPSEVDELRAGNRKGPLYGKSETEYLQEIKDGLKNAGFSDEQIGGGLQEAGATIRAATEDNLHYITRSGDYIESKKGVRWTLDGKGMLHPSDGGAPVPLLKSGRYSSQVLDLARNGKVGWGSEPVEVTRARVALQRSVDAALTDELRKKLDDAIAEARLQQQNAGLQVFSNDLLPPDTSAEERAEKVEAERRARQEVKNYYREQKNKDKAAAGKIADLIKQQLDAARRERVSVGLHYREEREKTRKAASDLAALIQQSLEKSGAKELIDYIAKGNGITPDEVVRLQIAAGNDVFAQIAGLEVGDKITDGFRPDHPWVVEKRNDGKYELVSRGAHQILERTNPSKEIQRLVREGKVIVNHPVTDQEREAAAFKQPFIVRRKELVDETNAIESGQQVVPDPTSQAQAEAQQAAAEDRVAATIQNAADAQAKAIDPPPGTTERQSEINLAEAENAKATAEAAVRQEAKAFSKTVPAGEFHPRAPISINRIGNRGVIKQNGVELQMHYEIVPLDALVTSHLWEGNLQVVNPEYTKELQPRTINEMESKMNAIRAGIRQQGSTVGYDFDEYADKTISGSMGPAIIEPGGRVVGGNTRIGIMRKYLQNLNEITDVDSREVAIALFRERMNRLARENGITPPEDDLNYAVVRVLDEPIETLQRAAELGRLFNKSVSVQMTEAAKGVSYAKSLTDENIATIGRMVEDHDGLLPAIAANPAYFAKLVTDRFGIVGSEYADWFEPVSGDNAGLKLNEKGKSQFSKIMLGTIFKDSEVLNRIYGEVPYRAIERAMPNLMRLRAIGDKNITPKIIEAVVASADTLDTDPKLSQSNDRWAATYRPDQEEFLGMEKRRPTEPDRMVEAIWRALHASKAASPRVFSERLENFIGADSAANESLFGATAETPAEAFNRVFAKEFAEVAHSRKDPPNALRGITQKEYDAALQNLELSDIERQDAIRAEQGKPPKEEPKKEEEPKNKAGVLTPPPTGKGEPVTPETVLKDAKAEKGYVTPEELKTFLESHPGTKKDASTIMRVARMMAAYVYDQDAPEGMSDKQAIKWTEDQALEWILKERVAKLDSVDEIPIGDTGRKAYGSYSDPEIEKGIGDGILRMAKAGDATTFIHEFAHVIFPMLSKEDLAAIDTIIDVRRPKWDRKKPLRGDNYRNLTEKFAHALERFLRDENPKGFTAEVKKVLAKIKEIFRRIYMDRGSDPLNTFELTPEAKEVFASMFHIDIEDMEIADLWHEEVEKAKKEERKKNVLKGPEEGKHAVQAIAKDMGAFGIRSTAGPTGEGERVVDQSGNVVISKPKSYLFEGKKENEVGDPVDPRKPTAILYYPDLASATVAFNQVGMEGSKIQGAKLLRAEDGSYGIQFNTPDGKPVPDSILYQETPKLVEPNSPELLKWFGDSKVVDEDGKPLRVYHGTDRDFEAFDPSKAGESTRHPTSRLGTFFSSDPGVASLFSGGVDDTQWPPKWKLKTGAKTVPVFLKVDKPFEMTADQWRKIVTNSGADGAPEFKANAEKYIDAQRALLEKQGYDGVHIKGDEKYRDSMTEEFGHDNWVVFKPEQIKSAIGNRGTFDPLDPSILHQEIPEKEHPGVTLEKLKKTLKFTPKSSTAMRALLEKAIQNLENEIRAKYGYEERKPQDLNEVAKAALEEKKNAVTGKQAVSNLRGLPEGSAGDLQRRGTGQVSKPSVLGGPNDASVRSTGGPLPGTKQLTGTKPVRLEPLPERGQPVGILHGQKFDAKAWKDGLSKAGLPDNAPPPTVALSAATAQQLKYAGQKQIVQMALSALEQGDGFVVASGTGTGKTYTLSGIIREFVNANPAAKVLYITKNSNLLETGEKSFKSVAKNTFGIDAKTNISKITDKGVYGTTYQRLLSSDMYKSTNWDLVVADESGEMRNWFDPKSQQGKAAMEVIDKSKKAVYASATPFHSPSEYGYVKKLNLWPPNEFEKWIGENFNHENRGGKVYGKLDPGKQAILRNQLIERGQFVSQMISYEGFTTHFGVVPVTVQTRIALNRIHEGIARAKERVEESGNKGLVARLSAFEATYTKAFLERTRVPEAIELAKRARDAGWHVLIFSETTSADLFRRPLIDANGKVLENAGTYRLLDQEMNGELSRIIPEFGNVYEDLKNAFGDQIEDFSGGRNTEAQRAEAKKRFNDGTTPMMYTTYAAGGIGQSFHDEQGTKPRLSIFLGPPYSGVLLEQAMGRTWRFGVNSDARAVFLATDSLPDIHLMATKIGPRMRALRASVQGERDALGSLMANYTEEQKQREQQDLLAFDQGNEVVLDANSFQQKVSRKVDIDNWHQINFPRAETAYNKGMKVKVAGTGDNWATLYQEIPQRRRFNRPPPTAEEAAAWRRINTMAKATMEDKGLPPSEPITQVDPPDKEQFVANAATIAATETAIPVDRDNEAVARMVMERLLLNPATRNQFRWNQDTLSYEYAGTPEQFAQYMEQARLEGEKTPDDNKYTVWAPIFFNQEVAIRDIGWQSNSMEAANNIVRRSRMFDRDQKIISADWITLALDAFRGAKLDPRDPRIMAKVWDVTRGTEVTSDPKINYVAQRLSPLHEIIHGQAAEAGVEVTTPDGREVRYGSKEFPSKPNWMPVFHDWNAKLEDPLDGKTYTLREVMGKTFAEKQRERILKERIRQSKSTIGYVDYVNELRRNKGLRQRVLGHAHRTREMDFPIIKKDWQSLVQYYEQMAEAISSEKNFGHKLKDLNNEIDKIKSENGRKGIANMFKSYLTPEHDSETFSGKFYNRMTTYEMATKMTLSAAKVAFHAFHAPMALGGWEVRPFLKAGLKSLSNPKAFMEHGAYLGTVIRDANPFMLIGDAAVSGWAHRVLNSFGFEMMVNWGRALAGAGARIYLEQYALKGLRNGNERIRRVVKDNLLIGDHAIDQAIQNGRWEKEDLDKAEVAFANMVMFSDRYSLQMPTLARLNTEHAWLNNCARMTYALQTFVVKETSFLRQNLFDEMVLHGNFRPLLWAMVAEPIIGNVMMAVSAAAKGGIQQAAHKTGQAIGVVPQNAPIKDKFEQYLDLVKDDFDHGAIGMTRFAFDGACYSLGLDRLRRYGDATLEMLEAHEDSEYHDRQHRRMAATERKQSRGIINKASMIKDELEDAIGADWSTLVIEPIVAISEEMNTLIGHSNPNLDHKWRDTWANAWKTIIDEVPVLGDVPEIKEWASKNHKAPPEHHRHGGG